MVRCDGRCDGGGREIDPEGAALIDRAFDAERPPIASASRARQREAEARAFDRGLLRTEPLERVEQQLAVSRRRMPGPVSVTLIRSRAVRGRLEADRDACRPSRLYFTALRAG